jgi:23S rRNA maturation-related 3'-5' exoribonuclease YhaM
VDVASLLAGASKLQGLVGTAMPLLLSQGKSVLAHELKTLDDALIALEKRVENQHPTSELGKIALEAEEIVLQGLEHKLQDFITKNTGSFYADTKDQLIADASKLKTLAGGEIAKLLAGGKTVLAKELQVLDDAVVALEKRVEAQHPETEVGKIALQAEETVLKGLEGKLQDFIKKAGGAFYEDTKDTLIADASKLKTLAGSEIAKLLAGGKTVLAKELQVLDDAVVALEKRVEAQHPTTDIGKIALEAEETVLKGLEGKLQEFIKKNSGSFYEDTKDTLIADASKLKNIAGSEIAKLLAGGKTVLAKELQVLDDALIALEKRVESQHPTTEIGKIALEAEETVLKGLEGKLEEFIKKNASL